MTTTNTQVLNDDIETQIDNLTQDVYAKHISGLLINMANDKPSITLAQLIAAFSQRSAVLHDALMHIQLGVLKGIFAPPVVEVKETKGGKRARSEKPKFPSVENFSKDEVKAAFMVDVRAFIESKGLTESGRGVTPAEIRDGLRRGSEPQTREALKGLVAAGDVVATGTTKGLRYVVASLRAQAQAKHAEEVAAREAKKAEKAAK